MAVAYFWRTLDPIVVSCWALSLVDLMVGGAGGGVVARPLPLVSSPVSWRGNSMFCLRYQAPTWWVWTHLYFS